MESSSKSSRRRSLFRLINIACAIFVISYILFDVLDLDGSDWPMRHPVEGQAFIVNAVAEIKPTSFLTITDHRKTISNEFPSSSEVSACFPATRELLISALETSRRHRYPVALPRSSIADLSGLVQG